jgi:hypothetical protein
MKRSKINGQFAPRTIEMLRSPAMQVLSLTGRRILDRLEIELSSHGGRDNGGLPVTHDDLVEFGIDRHAIGPALREIEVLGFVEIKRGRAGNAEFRRPNLFRLTYRPTKGGCETDEWRQIQTVEQAEKIAARARGATAKNQWRRGRRKHFPVGETHTKLNGGNPHQASVGETPTNNSNFSVGETPTTLEISSHLVGEDGERAGRASKGSRGKAARVC